MSSLGIAISVCLVYSGLRQVVIVKSAFYKAVTLAWPCHEFMKPITSVVLCVWSCDGVGPFGVYAQRYLSSIDHCSPSAAIL